MKNILTILPISAFCFVGTASAATIFNASTSNTTLVDNGVASETDNSLTGSPGSLVFTQSGGQNNNAGFTSTSSINTLLGTPLTAADTVTFTATISSMTGDLRSHGIAFGMNPSAIEVTEVNNLMFELRPNDTLVAMANNPFDTPDTALDFGVTEASLLDGFGITLVVNNAGWTFSLFGVTATSGTTIKNVSGTFTGTQFVDNFGSGHFQLVSQKEATPNPLVMNISEASISVIPEPSALAMLGLGLGALMLRRRR